MSGLIDKLKGSAKPLKEGDKISAQAVKENDFHSADVHLNNLKGKNLILGVPGAFTAPCANQLGSWVEHVDKFAAKGVAGIYVVAVNDQFVTSAWKKDLGATNPLFHFIADDTGRFTKDVGMAFDAEPLLGNDRSKRYVAVVDNGTVHKVFAEPDDTKSTVTQAENILQSI